MYSLEKAERLVEIEKELIKINENIIALTSEYNKDFGIKIVCGDQRDFANKGNSEIIEVGKKSLIKMLNCEKELLMFERENIFK